jgi:hypothetical protein
MYGPFLETQCWLSSSGASVRSVSLKTLPQETDSRFYAWRKKMS